MQAALGLGGLAIGLALAFTAVLRERRRRAGLPVDGIPESGLAFRHARRTDGIERYVILRAAAWSFPVLLLTFSIYGPLEQAFKWSHPGSLIFGLAWGIGGLSFGIAMAVVARRAA